MSVCSDDFLHDCIQAMSRINLTSQKKCDTVLSKFLVVKCSCWC